MIKLKEEVKFYLSFMDEEVFQGVDLPEEDRDKPLASTSDADTLVKLQHKRPYPPER